MNPECKNEQIVECRMGKEMNQNAKMDKLENPNAKMSKLVSPEWKNERIRESRMEKWTNW